MIGLSATASNVMLDALSELMDGGSIELRTRGNRTIAKLALGNPAARAAAAGELEFNEIGRENTAEQGIATAAHIFTADGREVFACDVGDENSDAVIKLNTVDIRPGVSVDIKSFKLVMP